MILYEIYKTDGTKIGVTDEPNFITISEDGRYVSSEHRKAVGISHKGILYNLFGHSEIPDADTVMLVKTDIETIFESMISYSELAEVINEGVNQVE